jgi:hypothetical protein
MSVIKNLYKITLSDDKGDTHDIYFSCHDQRDLFTELHQWQLQNFNTIIYNWNKLEYLGTINYLIKKP